jgi:8-oxo-dGTP pyrophosphatase MutT (NUDIX family)
LETKACETREIPTQVTQDEIVFQNRFHKIQKYTARFSDFKKEYFVADYGPKACILIQYAGKILFVKQYRLFPNDISKEIPGGAIDPNESARLAATRECLEETGIKIQEDDLELLIEFHQDLEYTKNYTSIFFANLDTKTNTVETDPEKTEWLSLDEALQMIHRREILDSMSIIALLSWANRIQHKE